MRVLVSVALGLLAVWAAAPLAAQNQAAHPNFSGNWKLDPSRFAKDSSSSRFVGFGPGEERLFPTKKKDVAPVFPPDARSKVSGTVLVQALLDTSGEVVDIRIARSVPEFDEAAIDAVSQWVYTPMVQGGAPVEIALTTTVPFTTDRGRLVQSTAVPMPSPLGFGSGMWRGHVPASLAISQDARELSVVRQSKAGSDTLTYRLDGKPSQNILPHAGGTEGDAYTYASQWVESKLVTNITWVGPNGWRTLKETLSFEGDTTLLVTTLRADRLTGTVAYAQSAAYVRRK